MSTFDPWTASLDEASNQPNADDPQGAFQQWATAQELIQKKELILGGDGFLVLWAVARCAVSDLVMPNWLAMEFLKRYRAVAHCKVDSWDSNQAFGRPYPKGAQIAALRRKRKNTFAVARVVLDTIYRDPEHPIDEDFWTRVGNVIGEGKTNAQKLHAKAIKMGIGFSPKAVRAQMRNNGKPTPTNSPKLTGRLRRR